MPQIRIVAGPDPGAVYQLASERFAIGRDPASDLPLGPDSPASRRHAAIYLTGGRWRIQDLGSRNGTKVNDAKVEDTEIFNGDRVQVGEMEFVFEGSDAAAPAAPAAAPEDKPVPVRRPVEPPIVESAELQAVVQAMRVKTETIMAEIGKAIIGQREIVKDVLTAIIARGHVLLIGMPGLAKTTLVRTISEVLDLNFKRIQFTPDLMPS
ncbi:MAG TPA: FHA domain-containing protein, partial [Chthoniobacteraceae bacterium]|nr:FHA domain-containing protein [Chthoniobacteraceae bacterium]